MDQLLYRKIAAFSHRLKQYANLLADIATLDLTNANEEDLEAAKTIVHHVSEAMLLWLDDKLIEAHAHIVEASKICLDRENASSTSTPTA